MSEWSAVLTAPPPNLDREQAAELTRRIFGLSGVLTQLGSERDQNFMVDAGSGKRFLLKLSNAAEDERGLDYETEALLHILRTDPTLPVMTPLATTTGEYWDRISRGDGVVHLIRMFSFLEGTPGVPDKLDVDAVFHFGVTLARLGRSLRSFFHPAAGRRLLWDEGRAGDLRPLVVHVPNGAHRALVTRALDRFDDLVLPLIGTLRAQTIHNDFTLDNTLMGADRRVSGILDFGDLTHTVLMCDLSTAMSSVMFGREDQLDLGEALVAGYGSVTPLEDLELRLLPDLLAARLVALVTIAAWRLRAFPDNEDYIMASVPDATSLLRWLDGGGYADLDRRLQGGHLVATRARSRASSEDLSARRSVLGSALSPLSYDRPLELVRGEGPWLFDEAGERYLDAYNNVPVVGHCHPHVTRAIAAQASALNTNLRYLHENAIELAERLCATLPEGLDVCMFVNSGSEANDLAWQLASVATGGSGGIVTAHAYHGITSAVTELSPEHWASGHEPHAVATIPAPDGYAGIHRRDDPAWATAYATHADEALAILRDRGVRPAALYLDSGFTSDGILMPPPEYGRALVDRVREEGALFVADEVQTGFGRLGDHLWGFQSLDVVPDIVTLGKPMGNGHPVAAVLTTSEIVDRFAGTMDFFSTFGGNPVACAAGLAVLDVIEEGSILRQAAATGAALLEGLQALSHRHVSVGEVRGRGLLAGVVLVSDRRLRSPDPVLAGRVINEMRERGVLIGTTGPHGNVLKIRPPLVITAEHVEILIDALDESLTHVGENPGD